MQDMIMGLFNNQRLRLGDKISQVDLSVRGAEMSRLPELQGPPVSKGQEHARHPKNTNMLKRQKKF